MGTERSKPAPRQTRDEVLAAAMTLFVERGYFGTSVHDIVGASNVSIGSIYHHFGDKAGIARALYAEQTARMDALIAGIAARHRRAAERCRAIVAALFELTEVDPVSMAFMLHVKHREFIPDEKPVCSSKPFESMRRIVLEGIARGEIRPIDVMVASTCLFGGALRMITARLDGVLPRSLPDYLDEVWESSWRAVAA